MGVQENVYIKCYDEVCDNDQNYLYSVYKINKEFYNSNHIHSSYLQKVRITVREEEVGFGPLFRGNV